MSVPAPSSSELGGLPKSLHSTGASTYRQSVTVWLASRLIWLLPWQPGRSGPRQAARPKRPTSASIPFDNDLSETQCRPSVSNARRLPCLARFPLSNTSKPSARVSAITEG